MPVRFTCPHCRQKLSVSSRKAGRQADCPRCGRALTIPSAVEPDVAQVHGQHPAPLSDERQPHVDLPREDAASAPAAAALEHAASAEQHRHANDHSDDDPHRDFEVVFDTSGDEPLHVAADEHPDLIAVPRLVLYLQGGLLAVVAVVSFALGVIAGGAFSGGAAPAGSRACTLEGTINYAAGTRHLPDPGAVVAVIPASGLRPQRKAPISGLRPDDATPDENHHGIAILRELGGGYTRTDDRGRFTVQLPDRGKYLVLVVSSARDVDDLEDISTADLVKLGPFFDNAAGLLGRHQYRLTSEIVRSDRQLNVVFE